MLGRRNFIFFSLGLAAGAVASAVGVAAYYKFVKLRPVRLAVLPERSGVTSSTSGWILTDEDITSFHKERK